jgi:hypothetical protein
VVEFIFECASLLHDVWLDLLVFWPFILFV